MDYENRPNIVLLPLDTIVKKDFVESVKPIEEDDISLPDPCLDPARTNIVRARTIRINGVITRVLPSGTGVRPEMFREAKRGA